MFQFQNTTTMPTEEELLLMQIKELTEKQKQAEVNRSPAGVTAPKRPPAISSPGTIYLPYERESVQTIKTLPPNPISLLDRQELKGELAQARGQKPELEITDPASGRTQGFNREIESFKLQSQGLQEIKEALKKALEQPQAKPDAMIPLLAGAQWFASPRNTPPDFLSPYQLVEKDMQGKNSARQAIIEKLQKLQQEAETDMAKSDTSLINAFLRGQQGAQFKTDNQSGFKTDNPNANRSMPVFSRAMSDVQKRFNDSIKPFNQSLTYADEVLQIVGNTGPGAKLAQKNIDALLAKSRGEVGNLAVYEQVGNSSARDILGRLEQTLSTLSNSELTPENKAAVIDLANQYKEAANSAIGTYRMIHAKQGSAAYGGIIPDAENTLMSALSARDNTFYSAPKVTGSNAGSQASQPSAKDQAALKWLNSNEAKNYPDQKVVEAVRNKLKQKGLIK